jgi:hypothetical protein
MKFEKKDTGIPATTPTKTLAKVTPLAKGYD